MLSNTIYSIHFLKSIQGEETHTLRYMPHTLEILNCVPENSEAVQIAHISHIFVMATGMPHHLQFTQPRN